MRVWLTSSKSVGSKTSVAVGGKKAGAHRGPYKHEHTQNTLGRDLEGDHRGVDEDPDVRAEVPVRMVVALALVGIRQEDIGYHGC